MNPRPPRHVAGFTLVELLIVVALASLVLGLAAPSFTSFIQMQRLRGINAQLVTDIQFARSEAVSRNVPVHLRFQKTGEMSCYTLYTNADPDPSGMLKCDCSAAEGSRCTNALLKEVRTVQVPAERSVFMSAAGNLTDNFSFDPRTGGMVYGKHDFPAPAPDEFLIDVYIDGTRKLRDTVGLVGRVKVCSPAGSTMSETAC